MTSLLAFAWRKSLSTPSNGDPPRPTVQKATSHDSQHVYHDNVGISSSYSDDTLSYQPNTDALFTVDEVVRSRPSLLRGQYTPEALKVRKTSHEIREELGLPPKRLYQCDRNGVEKTMNPFATTPILPPMPTVNGLPSPQVSTASFYPIPGHFSDDNVARSPSLRPGEAKTAVGALLAMNGDIKPMFVNSHYIGTSLHAETSILPSREWLQDDRSVDEANDFSIELPYDLLNDSHGHLSAGSRGYSEAGSVAGSSIHSLPENLPNTSFTRGFLEHITKESYDFEPLVDREVVPADESASVDMSYMSQSTAKDIESMESMGCDSRAEQIGEVFRRDYLERRETEYLILSIFERLRDDTELVSDVLNAMDDNRVLCDSVEASGRDGILSGFSDTTRDDIVRALDSRLKRNSSNSLKFQMLEFCRSLAQTSSSSCEQSSDPHWRTMSASQRHRWRVIPGIRAAIGLNELTRSPETMRGGDTSVFSLPSESAQDATPHTSNVSMTSTITTAVSPERNRYHAAYANGERLRRTIEMLCMALSSLGAECKKFAAANKHESGAANMAMEAIQNIYDQLMMLPNDDLKSWIDSFELELLDRSISRIVSADEDEERTRFPPRVNSSWNPSTNHQGLPQTWARSVESIPYGILEEEPTEERDNADLFSPRTLDMLSVDIMATPRSTAETIDDDLRRTIGSFDNEDDTEGRDGPPALELQRQAMRGKRTKTTRSLFGRMPFRRRQAAE